MAEILSQRSGDTENMHHQLALTANLLGEPARAAMLLQLMNGRTLPAGELAMAANISPQTASGHLAKLIEGNLVGVERQGRHRYYRLLGTEVADAVEALLTLTAGSIPATHRHRSIPEVGTLGYARTCYAHLAGWLAVQITDALQAQGLILPANAKAFAVTQKGQAWFEQLGVPAQARGGTISTRHAKQCLDWTERRPHLAGSLGVALYRRFLDLKWMASIPKTRAVRVTVEGRRELQKHLQIATGGL